MAQILILTAEEGKREIAPGEQNPQTFVSSYRLSHLNAYWQAIRIFIFLLSVLLAGEGRETLLFEKFSPAPPHGFSVDPGLLSC
jgi:hypothetical protein